MLTTRFRRRETLVIEVVGKGLFHPFAATGSPYRSAGRPTPTSKHPVFGALVKATAVDLLADVEHLRAFTDVLACDLNCSPLAILEALISVLERKQWQQADDMSNVLRLGRVRQIAARELDRLLGER